MKKSALLALLFFSTATLLSNAEASATLLPKAEASADTLAVARQVMRCAIVFEFAAHLSQGEQRAEGIDSAHRLIDVANKLGASSEQLDAWEAEFSAEFGVAVNSKDPTKDHRVFMRAQAAICTDFLNEDRQKKFTSLLKE